jgi:2,4-diketo-3-deoxy-L-fuconate hydrolase
VIQPRGSTKLDWEVELAFAIGTTCRYVDEAAGAAAIAGYFVCNDISERAFQLERGGLWDKGKGCDSFGPIGPWLVTPDELGDAGDLSMWLEVNGRRFQNGSTRTMIFKPAFLVSYLSQFMSLQPGDVVTTGTPPGVGLGQVPPLYLKVGDTMHLGIQGLGEQRQVVVAAE